MEECELFHVSCMPLVCPRKEWLSLKAEYIAKQKSHMAALKESLRELRLQENQGQPQSEAHFHHSHVITVITIITATISLSLP